MCVSLHRPQNVLKCQNDNKWSLQCRKLLELDYNFAIRDNQLQGPGFIDRLSCSIVIISLSFDLVTQSAVKK